MYMSRLLELSKEAMSANEVPVAAMIVQNNTIISETTNQMYRFKNPTYHAELLCIQDACTKLNTHILDDCDLYVTVEPCAMCAGAIVNAKIKRLFFGAYDIKGGAICHGSRVLDFANRKVDWTGGIEEQACQKILQDFFQTLRS